MASRTTSGNTVIQPPLPVNSVHPEQVASLLNMLFCYLFFTLPSSSGYFFLFNALFLQLAWVSQH